MKQPVEVWVCPLCHTRVSLFLRAHGRPTCAHVGTPRAAAREVLMVLETPTHEPGVDV